MNMDEQLRDALHAETPDASRVVTAVRAQIQRETRRAAQRRWLGGLAGGVLLVGIVGTVVVKRNSPPQAFAAAIRDHRVEVVQQSPRRWNLGYQTMQPLLEQYQVGWNDVQALLPVGFVLEKAKQCRLEGSPALHLVFSNGSRALSVYIRQGSGNVVRAQTVAGGTEAASFRRGHLSGIVVTSDAPGLCAEAIRRLSSL